MNEVTLLPNAQKITGLIREHHEPLQASLLDNLEETSSWKDKLPKPTQGEIGNLSRPVASKEIELVIENLPWRKAGQPHWQLYQAVIDRRVHTNSS